MGPTAIAVLDANRDGRADVAVANSLDDTVSLLIGLGGGSFAPPRNFAVGVGPSAVISGDVDGDGRVDLVVTNSDGTVDLLRGTGDGDFVVDNIVADIGTIGPALGDLDGDRILDLVVASREPRQVLVLTGDRGWEHLVPRTVLPVIGQPVGIAVEDLNRDGQPDVVVARRGLDGVSVFLSAGDGRFQAPTEADAGPNPTSVTVADVTGDNRFDVLVTNEQPDHLNVLAGDGQGHLATRVEYAVGRGPRRALVADVNGDTLVDVVSVNSFDDTVSLLIGRRASGFDPAADFQVGTTPLDLALADFSGDGRPDVMTVNIDEDDLSLLINNSDRVVLPGDVNADGRWTAADIDVIITEIFDGDGDCPFDTGRGFIPTGPSVNANGDARVTSADLSAVLRMRNRP